MIEDVTTIEHERWFLHRLIQSLEVQLGELIPLSEYCDSVGSLYMYTAGQSSGHVNIMNHANITNTRAPCGS